MEVNEFLSNESRTRILKQLNLEHINDPLAIHSNLARFVYCKCQHLVPHKILELFHRKGLLENFIKDIEQHLEFKFSMVNFVNEDNNKIIERNDHYIKDLIVTMENIEDNFKYNNTASNYQKYLKDLIRVDLGLGLVEKERTGFHNLKRNNKVEQVAVPEYLAPFIFFMTINHDIHSNLKKHNVSSLNYLSKKIVSYRKLISNYKGLQRLICLYYFEKQYNLGLCKQILMYLDNFAEKNRKDIAKVLGLAALLPNIKGRLTYIKVLAESRSLMKRDLEDFENESYWTYYNQGSQSEDELWMNRTIDILLQLAFITIPVMEVCYFHLRYQYASKPSIKKFNTICNRAFNLAQKLTDSEAENFEIVNSAAQTVKAIVHLEDLINDMKSSDKIINNKKSGLIYFGDTAFRDPDTHLELVINHAVSVKKDLFIKEANILI
ncbi:hypothetical protein [Paenibacillus ehimensis]|uniref:hypothetical protein n=1 Tax=Paenibacillus ehimensis TaxID=79264 RepID=UPI000FD809EE|nr:hypothetical protein [Paenibacillus ehimensis]